MTIPIDTLTIDDVNAAAFVVIRCRLLSTTQQGTRTRFVFDDTDGQASQAALEFINGPEVNLRTYLAALRELRSVLFAARKPAQ